jgi:hypothetical protein
MIKRKVKRRQRSHVQQTAEVIVVSKQTKTPSAPATPEATAAAGSDKERTAELNARTASYQSKVPSDLQEKKNIDDIVQTMQNELNAIAGLRRPDGAGSGGLQQPRVVR